MKKTIFALLVTSIITLTAYTSAIMTTYEIADNYTIAFSGTGASGTFSGLSGAIIFDKANLDGAKMDVRVAAETISTGNITQDKHARGESWFDVEKYPTIQFQSTNFEANGHQYIVRGDLTMHGVTKEMSIPFTFKNNVFEGSITVSRSEFGIKGPFFAFTVSDEFEVQLRVPVK